MPKSKQREVPEINASSMADIAFLLLIFFLVTTTMDIDKGILVTLPPYDPEQEQVDIKLKKRNVLEILVNARDQLLVEGELADVGELKDVTMEHVANPSNSENYSESPQDAIVSLQNDKGTSYKRYLEVYNEIRSAYSTLRNDEAQKRFNLNYDELTKDQQREVRQTYPLKLSEADPTDFEKGEE